jgi:hypothetical protein
LQFEWSYLQRVLPDCGELFAPLETEIKDKFLPAIFGNEVTETDRTLFSLPAREGGIGVKNPAATATASYETSHQASEVLINTIKGQREFNSEDHRIQTNLARSNLGVQQKNADSALMSTILAIQDVTSRRTLQRIRQHKTSSWLTVLPLVQHHFDLSAVEFRDALALRYRRPLLRL